MLSLQIFASSLFLALARSVEIDNGLIGPPIVDCGVAGIVVGFETQKPFFGKVFIKGHASDPRCNTGATRTQSVMIMIPHTSCNSVRSRSLNPPGIQIHSKVIISFHEAFLTKVDRAYSITCFYMEATKTVGAELDVSQQTEEAITQNVVMPICTYEVLRGGPNGPPVRYARIGEPVYHKWTCDSDREGVFCMLVHSCQVRDSTGEMRHLLVDEAGCSVDRYLLQHINYFGELSAGREAHVFKFADTPAVFFECQISLAVRADPNQPCPTPQCNELPFQGQNGNSFVSGGLITEPRPFGGYQPGSRGGFGYQPPGARQDMFPKKEAFNNPNNNAFSHFSKRPSFQTFPGGYDQQEADRSVFLFNGNTPSTFPRPKPFEDKPGVRYEVDPTIPPGYMKKRQFLQSGRAKRDIATWLKEQVRGGGLQGAHTLDAISQRMNVLDLEDDLSDLPNGECPTYAPRGKSSVLVQVERAGPGKVCVSTAAFVIVVSATLIVAISTVIVITIAVYRNSVRHLLNRNQE